MSETVWVVIDWNDDGAEPVIAFASEDAARHYLETEGFGHGWAIGSCELYRMTP